MLICFAKESYFGEKLLGNKSTRDKSLIRLLQSPAIMVPGIATILSPENPDEVIDRLKLLLQEKQAGNYFDIINEEILAVDYKLLEHKCISTKQHKFLLLKCVN